MSNVWGALIGIQHSLEAAFEATGSEIFEPGMERFNKEGWINRVWTSDLYRRAHLDVVDARDSRGLWMMHCCIFPHTHNSAPIYGFDVVAGKSKITGCFHDFSATTDNSHPMITWFGNYASELEWRKERKLPPWAERIFSPYMVAASNVQLDSELEQICIMAADTLQYYLAGVASTNNTVVDSSVQQDYYCENQRQNPHTPKVMVSLGLNEDDVGAFVSECLFPAIK